MENHLLMNQVNVRILKPDFAENILAYGFLLSPYGYTLRGKQKLPLVSPAHCFDCVITLVTNT